MAHIEDRWYKTVVGDDGKKKRVKTGLHGKGLRYRVRYVAPDGRERSQSFPDREKKQAEDFLIKIENDKRAQTYVDPHAGRISFRQYAEQWLATVAVDESTRENYGSRLRNHILPFFGTRSLASIKPEMVRHWDRASGLAVATRAVNFAILQAIFNAAIDDERIAKNPCAAKSVTAPKPEPRTVVPWTAGQVLAVRSGLLDRYRSMVDVAAGCGVRQGEAFGLSIDDLDNDAGWLHVRRQVKRVKHRLVFGLPKSDKERRVPLPARVSQALKMHVEQFPPVEVTLPWEDPDSTKLVTVPLVFTSLRPYAINRNSFDPKHWHRALRHAGIAPGRDSGMHALRHFYASVLLDAGENVKALSEYLGHANAAFTLRVYAHLMPGSQDRTRRAIDEMFGENGPDGLATA
ncbi:hypothetical protein CS0771_40550 [Catellatospora sp. IY07-71]|uniref:tyrosine-type recombinase/integrase n=1 Tax=Catellatospora sp. IY07-71 TaxID=2728827 RepID=UPI001BB3C402|nr:site-specific integrase [Catellatospora sp. IY07-71]BCJ74511.1 hypothetical protein CS0771_40550 [Catellatospora sp. IY07-71]